MLVYVKSVEACTYNITPSRNPGYKDITPCPFSPHVMLEIGDVGDEINGYKITSIEPKDDFVEVRLEKILEYTDEYDTITRKKSNIVLHVEGQSNQDGGKAKPKKTYKGRTYVIRTGVRGGKYIIVKGNKVYV